MTSLQQNSTPVKVRNGYFLHNPKVNKRQVSEIQSNNPSLKITKGIDRNLIGINSYFEIEDTDESN